MGIENPVHLLFIALVALIVLGPKRLPALARALGEGIREFRASLEEGVDAVPEPEPPQQAPGAQQPQDAAAPPQDAAAPPQDAASGAQQPQAGAAPPEGAA